MFSSASSTSENRFDLIDRIVAHILVVALLVITPGASFGGDEFQDANNTTFDNSVVSLDNSQAGQTTFSIDTNSTTIDWQDLQQPNGNTLEFNFTDPNSVVLNDIGAQHPSNLNGSVMSNGTVAFANPFGLFVGGDAIIDVGNLVAIGGDVSRNNFLTSQAMLVPLTGTVENNGMILANGNVALLGRSVVNNGTIAVENGHILAIAGQQLTLEDWDGVTADFLAPANFLDSLTTDTVVNNGSLAAPNAALFGGRVQNFGEIEIEDGSLMMVAADSVWVTEFDNPVLIKIPNSISNPDQTDGAQSEALQYAIENHGRINAGLGHVRLAASDPLGFAIRQGTGSADAPASITAKRIELEGGEIGRVHLAGLIDASDSSDQGLGGSIDITGSMIVLNDAKIDASGSLGGGEIQIGGEQQGQGDLQRARVVIVDEATEIHADATQLGDGGRVILFAEDLMFTDGDVTARGGQDGGDGGFVETSGLRNFIIDRRPDVSARNGEGGTWLIDPFNIRVTNTAPDCPGEGIGCLNKSIDAILASNFDDAGFDGILRTVDPANNVPNANDVSALLIADALATGTSVILSTQAFGTDTGTDNGDIDILDEILVVNADTLEGTSATFGLFAAGDINVNERIASIASNLDRDGRANLALSIDFRANDIGQRQSNQQFTTDLLEGTVFVNADIRTGGGDVTLSGSSVEQPDGFVIDTNGGDVDVRSGTVSVLGTPIILTREKNDPTVDAMTPQPLIMIGGSIDTSDGTDPGGSVSMIASSLSVSTKQSGKDPLDVVTGKFVLEATGQITTGGGNVTLSGGVPAGVFGDNFAGNVDIDGRIASGGGDITITANHVDPDGDTGSFDVNFVDPTLGEGGEGGVIDIDLAVGSRITTEGGILTIGSDRTQSVQLDGIFDTRDTSQVDTTENGLVRLVALDSSAVDASNESYGNGEIVIGAVTGTTISTSGLLLESRNVSFSEGAGVNRVALTATGSSTNTLPNFTDEEEDPNPLGAGEVRITGNRQVIFNQNTEITGDSIRVTAAPEPAQLNNPEPPGVNDPPDSETRLVFGGTNGAGQTAADGVRLNADLISLSVGDGTTNSSDSFAQDEGTSTDPTDFGLQRLTTAAYDGLQMRSSGDSSLRPEELRIAQDNDLTITNVAPTTTGEIDLGAALDILNTTIGGSGMHTTLESSDGVLTIEDAAALNNGPGAGVNPASDAEKSFVVLNGGLFLPVSPDVPVPSDDTVVFLDGIQALGSGGTTAFDVESLTISTPGDFTITQQVIDSISVANELAFEAGRITEGVQSAGRGTLTVDGGITLQADDRLVLLAGAYGFGNLVFAASLDPLTNLVANDIDLRAGGGTESTNFDSSSRSRITGLQANVTIRDATGGAFGDTTSTATAFSYRQDAAIDAETDLPDLAQFGLLPADGFRAAGDLDYSVRSDEGNIDLNDGILGTNEGDRFRNAALSLIGVETTSVPAIDVSSEFSFVGKKIELGGISDFEFTQILAGAFNRSGLDADEEITLRAGIAIAGDLSFDRGNQSSVIVKAPTVNLVAGNGFNLSSEVQFESNINVKNAEFDLAGPIGSSPTFVFHNDALFDLNDLPDNDQFIGGNAGLPDVLVVRSDLSDLNFSDFDATQLPLDLTDDPGRLVMEAESITLSQQDGANLELTSIDNLNLRFRTNNLTLAAANINPDDKGLVLVGPRSGDLNPITGVDGDFDDESILIEGFDREATIATAGNLSSLSEDPTIPGQFDLDQGRGPTRISILQNGAVTSGNTGNLFNRNSVSGRLARSTFDDPDGMPIATTYTITSIFDTTTIEPENVNGSNLIISGLADFANLDAIFFEPGTGATPGVYDFEGVLARTQSSIAIKDGIQISATDSISLAAGLVPIDVDDPGLIFGTLSFENGTATTSLSANSVVLTAGPAFTLDGPGVDEDGEPDSIPDILLPRIDFTGLDEIVLTGDPETSLVDIKQSADLDSMPGGKGDFITPLAAGMGIDKWASLIVDVVQGNLILSELDVLKDLTESLTGRNTGFEGTLEVNVPNQSISTTPFDDFDGIVEFASNDITFVSIDPNTPLNLATENLQLTSFDPNLFLPPEDQVGKLRSDPDAIERPIVRIVQASDFTDTELPRPDQYFFVNAFDVRNVRPDLSGLDIELKTTGNILTLDNGIRARVTFANLILNAAGDVLDPTDMANVDIMIDGPTPGYAGLGYADLQLTSLEIITPEVDPPTIPDGIGEGTITVRSIGGPAELTIQTQGDQKFDGVLDLERTLATTGRDILFSNDITQTSTPDAGLQVATSGNVVFDKNIGSITNPLHHLWVTFDTDTQSNTPNVEFGRRVDLDGDGIAETPIPSDQEVWVLEDILFAAHNFVTNALSPLMIETRLADINTLPELETFLDVLGLGRDRAATFATIGKALGDLSFNLSNGHFIMASGEKLSVGGTATINVDLAAGIAGLGDAAAILLTVNASEIGLVRRDSGVNLDRSGETQQDAGASILANTIDFGTVNPVEIGPGRSFRFGAPNPFDSANLQSFLGRFPLFEINPDGSDLDANNFRFASTTGLLATQVPSLRPRGASRSDLSGAFGPKVEPSPTRVLHEPVELINTDLLLELSVDALRTPTSVRLARLEDAAVINDLELPSNDEMVTVTVARLDSTDTDDAIALYASLFGPEGERSGEIREILQGALDQYLANTRAQRVIGFELRRFVKNRPSTLLEAYQTLDALDALFRYHRRIGLSPGEYRGIQQNWLRRIQPDGITLDELAEAIHPSRYVRGSDILDIFGK